MHAPRNDIEVAVLIFEWPSVFSPEIVAKGVSLTSGVSYRRPPKSCFPSQAKCAAAYMIGSICRQEAEQQGFDDALLLTSDGNVGEASGANIFYVKDQEIITPATDEILNGLTRQTVIQMLDRDYVSVSETSLKELKSADEVFLTGTAYEVIGVSKIDDQHIPVGPISRKIREQFLALTR